MEIVKMEMTTPITRRVITYKGKKDIAKAIKEVNGLRFAVFTFADGTTKKDRVENYKGGKNEEQSDKRITREEVSRYEIIK